MSKKRHGPADERHFLLRTLSSDFPKGRTLAPHSHPWGQLIYAVSGVLSVWTEQGSWVAPPHWAVWAPAGVAHAMTCTGATSLRTLYVRPGLARQPRESAVISVSPLLRELILRATDIGMIDKRQPAHRALADLILHELCVQPTPSFELPQPRSARLRQIAEHVTAAPGERRGHAAFARRFGLSVRTLERAFAQETGLPFGRWRRQARMLYALRRLAAATPVKRVAAEAGYRSTSAFIAAFRAALHKTPGRYFQ
jgi:AraC-like DNA-binding protein